MIDPCRGMLARQLRARTRSRGERSHGALRLVLHGAAVAHAMVHATRTARLLFKPIISWFFANLI